MSTKRATPMSEARAKTTFIIAIIVFVLSVVSGIVTFTVTATKLNERVDRHEERLNKIEPLSEDMREIKFNLKKLMEQNGIQYTTVK